MRAGSNPIDPQRISVDQIDQTLLSMLPILFDIVCLFKNFGPCMAMACIQSCEQVVNGSLGQHNHERVRKQLRELIALRLAQEKDVTLQAFGPCKSSCCFETRHMRHPSPSTVLASEMETCFALLQKNG